MKKQKLFAALFIFLLILTSVGGYLLFKSKNRNLDSLKEMVMNSSGDEKENSKTILAFGDSLTAGFGLPLAESYPSQLENKLKNEGYDYKVINAGISGDTTAGGLERLDFALEGSKPEIVILTLGANDAFRGVAPAEVKKNLALIIEKIQKTNARVILGGMAAPRNLSSTYYTKFDSIYPELAREYQTELIPFFLDGVVLDPKFNLSDGIHPTKEGYRIIIDKNIWPVLVKLLK